MAIPPPLRTMDDSMLRTVGWSKQPHLLHSKWHMWYHNPGERDYSKSSFVDLFPKPIESLEELIILFNSWDEALPDANQGMYYLMREVKTGPIYPCREDPNNQNGGYWTCKINTDDATEVWKKLCFLMVNETVVEDWQKINGVSITPKQGFCLVKIWNSKDDTSDITQLKTYLANFLDLNACMYFNNQIKIAIDSRRQQPRGGHRSSRPSTERRAGGGGGNRKYPPRDSHRPHDSTKPRAFADKRQRARNSLPIKRGTSTTTPAESFSGGWRDLLKQQSGYKKPSMEGGASVYKPPMKSTKLFDF